MRGHGCSRAHEREVGRRMRVRLRVRVVACASVRAVCAPAKPSFELKHWSRGPRRKTEAISRRNCSAGCSLSEGSPSMYLRSATARAVHPELEAAKCCGGAEAARGTPLRGRWRCSGEGRQEDPEGGDPYAGRWPATLFTARGAKR
eukprot:4891452-Pleurochrysis_carterae.AAC.1